MRIMSTTLHSILFFLLALAILVAIHEFGHFWVARRFGIRVLRFSIGFGPRLLKKQDKTGTEYALSLIPLGGYVKMLDEREGPVPQSERHLAFNRRPIYQRFLVVLAGPIFNFILAIFAFMLMYTVGISQLAPIVGDVPTDSIAAKGGIVRADEIISVAGKNTYSWQQVLTQIILSKGTDKPLAITVKKPDHSTQDLQLDISQWQPDFSQDEFANSLGLSLLIPKIPPIIGQVIANTPAQKAKLQQNDRIVEINTQEVFYWQEMVDYIRTRANQEIDLLVERDNELISIKVTPEARKQDGETVGYLGVMVQQQSLPENMLRNIKLDPISAFIKGVEQSIHYTAMTFKVLAKLLTGALSFSSISGPIGIAHGAGQSASIGLAYYLHFLGLVSISLFVLNLLPIPVLDGGHLMYYAIEWVRGKPVSEKTQVVGFKIGMFLLLLLMAMAIYNDFVRLV